MSRTTGSSGAKTSEAIRKAGIKRIYAHGFEAMKLRDLAADVGIQAGSLYNYIHQKEDFLFELLREIMNELHDGLNRKLEGASDPLDAMTRFIEFHLKWHTARREEVFIGNMELRSLTPAHRREIVALRKAYEARIEQILEAGAKERHWVVADAKVMTYAIIATLTGVCNWYRPRGRLSQEDLVRIYTEIVLNSLGASKA